MKTEKHGTGNLSMESKVRAGRNKTISISPLERKKFKKELRKLSSRLRVRELTNTVVCQELLKAAEFLPKAFVDVLFLDPPYNLDRKFNTSEFREMSKAEYSSWMESWLVKLLPTLKPSASVYICGDWRSSGAIEEVAGKFFKIRNRITWEREKGRGAKSNWKNASEDIWFCTVSDDYYFNVEAVKVKRKVIAPYTDADGKPKDWDQNSGGGFRLTHPSNLWTDLTVPFWSMPENTDHPTQKPEKLLAKIILASSKSGDFIMDPFSGSGTTCVVAKKLGRRYLGIEMDEMYACLSLKRLKMAERERSIQGYADGVFWERNTLQLQKNSAEFKSRKPHRNPSQRLARSA
jgi:site-specific DNA-methyltransferase (adenine-specific)